jgi:hypothetical protein
MKTLIVKFELTNEQYADARAISKIYNLGTKGVLYWGIEGLIMPLLDAEENPDDTDEETIKEAKIYRKEHNRIMKKLQTVK